ncbi:MAG: hypothetical protein LBE81_04865 [Azonexus sp.]|jgi:hypothetical protein|uniref:hypothetical protein n=1 Tax=Azonexus sp. TaxID=1872668 RepID=UPI00281B70B4|nr:hypothetical protein [Azonexus sp.]MDR0775952.1 hypothetical protein [Azonexus sp.]
MTEWIEWRGGKCPVPPEAVVEYLMRDMPGAGDIVMSAARGVSLDAFAELNIAGDLIWEHGVLGLSKSAEIVGYRVVKSITKKHHEMTKLLRVAGHTVTEPLFVEGAKTLLNKAMLDEWESK